jgi:hypothetical protein
MSKKTFEQQLDDDMQDIIHCVTAPPARDDSKAEFDRICLLSMELQEWQHKYGDELLEEIESLIGDMARHLVENCGYEEFNHDKP